MTKAQKNDMYLLPKSLDRKDAIEQYDFATTGTGKDAIEQYGFSLRFVPGLLYFNFYLGSFQASVVWSTASTTNRLFCC